MIQSFADETTADIFQERNSKDARQIPKALWRVVQRKLKMLDVAVRIDDLESPPGNRLKSGVEPKFIQNRGSSPVSACIGQIMFVLSRSCRCGVEQSGSSSGS